MNRTTERIKPIVKVGSYRLCINSIVSCMHKLYNGEIKYCRCALKYEQRHRRRIHAYDYTK